MFKSRFGIKTLCLLVLLAPAVSWAQGQAYSLSISADYYSMYLTGGENWQFIWPDHTGRRVSLKIISSVRVGGQLSQNYIAIIDTTDPNDIFQSTFPLRVMNEDFYNDSRDPEHLKYHYNLAIDRDGEITMRSLSGGGENFTNVDQLYINREDQIQHHPTATIDLDYQTFDVIAQGGPTVCLLFFATDSQGNLREGPHGEDPGQVPNMMACVRRVGGGLQPDQDIVGEQCLGEYAGHGYTIRAVSNGQFEIRSIQPGSGPCE